MEAVPAGEGSRSRDKGAGSPLAAAGPDGCSPGFSQGQVVPPSGRGELGRRLLRGPQAGRTEQPRAWTLFPRGKIPEAGVKVWVHPWPLQVPAAATRSPRPGALGWLRAGPAARVSGRLQGPGRRPQSAHTCTCTCPAGVAGLASAQGLSPAGLLYRAACVPGALGVHQEADWLRRGCPTELRPPTQRGERGGAAHLDASRSYALGMMLL